MDFAQVVEQYGENYLKAIFETMSMTVVCFCIAMVILKLLLIR